MTLMLELQKLAAQRKELDRQRGQRVQETREARRQESRDVARPVSLPPAVDVELVPPPKVSWWRRMWLKIKGEK